MKRCAICCHADCRCGMDMYEDDDATAVAEPAPPSIDMANYPSVPMYPQTRGDRVAAMTIGIMAGFLVGFTLGVAAVVSGR